MPDGLIPANQTAVKCVAVVVRRDVVLFTVDAEAAVCDAVRVASDDCAEVRAMLWIQCCNKTFPWVSTHKMWSRDL